MVHCLFPDIEELKKLHFTMKLYFKHILVFVLSHIRTIFFYVNMRLFGFEPIFASLCMRLPQNFIYCLVDVLWQPHFFLVRFHACLLHRCGGVLVRHKSSAAPQPRWLALAWNQTTAILLLFSYQLLILSKIAIMFNIKK